MPVLIEPIGAGGIDQIETVRSISFESRLQVDVVSGVRAESHDVEIIEEILDEQVVGGTVCVSESEIVSSICTISTEFDVNAALACDVRLLENRAFVAVKWGVVFFSVPAGMGDEQRVYVGRGGNVSSQQVRLRQVLEGVSGVAGERHHYREPDHQKHKRNSKGP